MTERDSPNRRIATIAIVGLRWFTALAFVAAAVPKLQGRADTVAVFALIGLGQWFRVFTGVLEVLGALLLVVRRTAFVGASVLIAVMAGAVATHLFVLHNAPIAALLYLTPTVLIAWTRRADFGHLLRRAQLQRERGSTCAS